MNNILFQIRRTSLLPSLIGAFALVGAVCVWSYREGSKNTLLHQLSIVDDHIDLTDEFHWAGDRLVGVTQNKNTSNTDVYVHEIRKSCSCVSISIDDEPLLPGSKIPANSQLKLAVEMATQSAGSFSQSIQIEYGNMGRQHALLKISARVSQQLTLNPERVAFFVDERIYSDDTEFLDAHVSLVDSDDLEAPEFADVVASDPRIYVEQDER